MLEEKKNTARNLLFTNIRPGEQCALCLSRSVKNEVKVKKKKKNDKNRF